MELTYYGHACFGITLNGKRLLFDPFITPNELAKDVNVEAIEADYILVTHGHQDHVADVESIAKRTGAKVISGYEVTNWFMEKGLDGHPINHGGKVTMDFGTVKYVNAIHSSVLPDGSYGGNPGGFVIWNDEVCFYHAGDTALTWDMKLIPMTCPTLNFAILPIGDNFTMGYEDAVLASDFMECNQVVGCHYDTFGYIKIDHEKAQKTFSDKGKTLFLPEIGKTITV